MRRTFVLLVVIMSMFISCSPRQKLIDSLVSAVAEGKFLFGHQDDLMYGHDWTAARAGDSLFLRSDVFDVTGCYPYILGLDLGGIELGSECNLDGNDFGRMKAAALAHHERGGVLTFSWHLRNPLTGGDSWDVGKGDAVCSVLPGGSRHEMFVLWMDRVCDFLSGLRDEAGREIPVLWRPFHEHTGNWFWWCASECKAEEYNELWRMMYDYMVGTKGMKNLVWVISPSSSWINEFAERYPGDRYVDVVGLDCYSPTAVSIEEASVGFRSELAICFDILGRFCSEHDKILAFCETGFEGIPDSKWWTEVLAPAIDGVPISYLLTWRNSNDIANKDTHFFCAWPGQKSEDDFREWVSAGRAKML